MAGLARAAGMCTGMCVVGTFFAVTLTLFQSGVGKGRGLIDQFLGNLLTLSQSGGTLCPHYYVPHRFSDFTTALEPMTWDCPGA